MTSFLRRPRVLRCCAGGLSQVTTNRILVARLSSTPSWRKDARHEAVEKDASKGELGSTHGVGPPKQHKYHEIRDQYAVLRDKYDAPKNPVVLAHGLLGFSELRLAGSAFPGLKYWRGIREALEARGIEVIVTAVPASGSLEQRALRLGESIAETAKGKSVNIIALVMLKATDCCVGVS